MPCIVEPSYDERNQYDRDRRIREEAVAKNEVLLCSACRVLERLNFDFEENPELSRWWDAHKKADAHRLKEEEKARLAADLELKRLTDVLAKPTGTLKPDDWKLLRKHGYI